MIGSREKKKNLQQSGSTDVLIGVARHFVHSMYTRHKPGDHRGKKVPGN